MGRALFTATVLLMLALPSAARADDARELFTQGVEAVEAGNWSSAQELFERAYAIKKHYQIATNLGMAELELGKHVLAATHLDEARKLIANEPGEEEAKARIDQLYADARKHVATIDIVSNVAGAAVTIDGQAVGDTPLDSTAFVRAGERNVMVTKKGFAPSESTVAATKGGEHKLNVILTPLEKPTESADSASDSTTEEGLPIWPALSAGGTGLVVIGIGFVVYFVGVGQQNQADDLRADLDAAGTRCEGGCDELIEAYGEADEIYNAAIGTWILGGALAVSSAAYLIWVAADGGDGADSAMITPRLSVGPSGAYAGATVSF